MKSNIMLIITLELVRYFLKKAKSVRSHTRSFPVKAWPPACSIKNDIGNTSYRTLSHKADQPVFRVHGSMQIHVNYIREKHRLCTHRSFPFGLFLSAGYKKMPP